MSAERHHNHNAFEGISVASKEKLFKWFDNANFEILPYKKVVSELEELPKERRISVTSSPTKSIENTLLFSKTLIESGRKAVVPHIAARHFTNPEHVNKMVDDLKVLNISQIFSIAGDNPQPSGEFNGSMDFLWEIQNQNIHFDRVDIAGYPEGHPVISNKILDKTLLEKQDWAQETKTEMNIITQMCFDSKKIVGWIEKIRKLGVKLPIIIGVQSSDIDPEKLFEFAKKSGVGDSIRFLTSNPLLAFNLGKAAIKKFDTDKFLIDLCKRTSDKHGVRGIHIFTFNTVSSTAKWIERSKDYLG